MGCMDSKVIPATVPFVSLAAPKLKCATYGEEIREAYSIKDAITFNSTTGLFVGEGTNTPNDCVYIRYARLNKSLMDPVTKRFDGISAQKADFPRLWTYESVGQTQFFLYLVMKVPRNAKTLPAAVLSGDFGLTEASICEAFCPIFDTLRRMHDSGIPHGQINPDKFLLINDNCYIYDVCVGNESTGDRLGENFKFLSPEELGGDAPSPAGDVWALGATIYYLVTGHPVYAGESYLELRTRCSSPADFGDKVWTKLSPSFKDLLRRMLSREKQDRPTMAQIVKHSWVRSGEALGRLSATIGNREALNNDVKRRACYQRTMYLIANNNPPRGINDLITKLRTADYSGTNNRRLQYGMIVETALGKDAGICANCYFFWLNNILYESFMGDVMVLNALINHERLSVLFCRLARKREYVTDEDIKRVSDSGLLSKMYTVPEVLGELIREHQKSARGAPILSYVEFVEMCQYVNFMPKEEVIFGGFLIPDEAAGLPMCLRDEGKR